MKKTAVISSLLMAGSSLATMAVAEQATFQMTELSSGYKVAMGEGKCGEGKCGGEKKSSEGKCGEGKCGGEKKSSEGKCGEGKCGGEKKTD